MVTILLLETVLSTVSEEINDHEDFPVFHRVLFQQGVLRGHGLCLYIGISRNADCQQKINVCSLEGSIQNPATRVYPRWSFSV